MDAGRGVPRHVHAPTGRHDRERCPAGHPAGAACEFLRPAVGGGRVRADAGRVPADRGQPGGHVRPTAAVPDRPGRVHLRVDAMRLCRHYPDAAAVPGPAGGRRGDHVRGVAGAAGRRLPRQGPRRRVRRLGHGDRPGGGDRPAVGRDLDLRAVLAVDLLRQRADRDRGRGDRGAEGGRVPGAARQPPRLGRFHDLYGGPGQPGLRADRVEPAVLHRRPGARLPRRGGRPAGRLRLRGAAHRAPDVRPEPVPAADLHRRFGRGVRAQRLDLRDAALPGAVPAGHPGLLGAGHRRAADVHLRRHSGGRHGGRKA